MSWSFINKYEGREMSSRKIYIGSLILHLESGEIDKRKLHDAVAFM
jgi:hypothetical protein